MDAVVSAIAALGQRTWIDYFAIFGPFVLSAVAIWIAVSGTQRQNKIALFEKRFEFYHVLKRCVAFQTAIHNSTTQDEIQTHFLAAFGNKVITKLTQDRLYDATIELYGQTIIFVKDKLIAQIERTLTLKGGIHP